MRIAGIMSGTSLDGIDVAIVDISGRRVRPVAHATTPYSRSTRNRILAAATAAGISRLNFELGHLYADAVVATCKRADLAIESLELVGCHGQTIYHEGRGPRANTLQIGEASVIAERLNISVVSDFRTRDIAAGGKGAPLVPLADYLLFTSLKRNRVALNIGGIANITVLPGAGTPDRVVAFDTGPGNMVIDQLVERMTSGRRHFDRDGAIAARHSPNLPLLAKLSRHSYYNEPPPKTAGREQYGAAFIERLLETGLPIEELIATATALTAVTIADGVKRFALDVRELIASGGGIHNRQLMGQIAGFLPNVRITTSDEYGIDPDAKEAIAFAILAYRTWNRESGNLPSATGASHPVVTGKITYSGRLSK